MTTTLFPDHRPTWQTESHELLRDHARAFFAREVTPRQADWARQGHVDRELWNRAGAAGLLLTDIAEKDGGGGGDFGHEAVVAQELAYAHDSAFGFTVHSTIVSHYINAYGTEEQKRRWLPGLASGEKVVAVAMTEPGTGSDLQNVKTTAIRDGDHYVVNGAKTFISNGILSDLVIVAAKADQGVTLVVVERGMEGFKRGRNLKKMGMKSQDTAELFFENVIVPKNNVLGQPGQGFIYLMQKLAQERLVCAIGAIAGSVFAFDETLKYVKERTAFGKPIGKFQNTRFRMAEMKTEITIGQMFLDTLVTKHLEGKVTPDEAAMSKWWCTDLLNRVVDQGVQFHGGYGYMMEYPIARAYVDARITPIFAGTNEIMKEIIGRGLGL